jgi:glycosyltransferase involved in cell wall biosynthesis
MTTRNSRVTVYIPSHNYGRYLEEAIESVLRQSVDTWELFLINENSTDKTWEIMNLYRGDDRVQIFNTPQIGLPGVANFVLERAKGEYLIRLDADDVMDENNLLVLSNYLDTHADIALVFPDYFLMDESGYIFSQERRQPIYYKNHMLDLPPNGASTMIRVDVLKQIGGYRTDLGVQDGFDLWTKVIEKYKCANVNLPLFYYRRHDKNLTGNKKIILSAKRKIKADYGSLGLDKFRPIVAVIPCRRNYDFVQDLWNQEIHGKSLLELSLMRCVESELFDQIVVLSDNEDALDVTLQYDDSRLMYKKRSAESTIRSRSIAQTLESVVSEVDSEFSGVTLLSILQSPFITTETMEEAIYTLVLNDADSTILVKEIDSLLFERTPHGLLQINYKGFLVTDFDVLYSDTRTCITTKNSSLKKGSLTGANIIGLLPPEHEIFYINNQRDLDIARALT